MISMPYVSCQPCSRLGASGVEPEPRMRSEEMSVWAASALLCSSAVSSAGGAQVYVARYRPAGQLGQRADPHRDHDRIADPPRPAADLRAALDERLRVGRRGHRRGLLPGLPGTGQRRAQRAEGPDVPLPGPGHHADPAAPLADEPGTEFGTIHNGFGGRPYRYTYAATNEPGWFAFNWLVKHDTLTGAAEQYQFEPGVFCSEVGVAPSVGGTEEDDAYLVTLTVDMNRDLSEVVVFRANDVGRGPIARAQLPERIASGTHSCWAPDESIAGW
jgi:hypothetical protein